MTSETETNLTDHGIGPEIDVTEFAEGPETWLDLIMTMYTGLVSEAVVGLLVGSAIVMSMYIHSNDMALPTVVLLLTSTALFGVLPGDYQQIAVGVLVIGIAAALFEIFRRYVW